MPQKCPPPHAATTGPCSELAPGDLPTLAQLGFSGDAAARAHAGAAAMATGVRGLEQLVAGDLQVRCPTRSRLRSTGACCWCVRWGPAALGLRQSRVAGCYTTDCSVTEMPDSQTCWPRHPPAAQGLLHAPPDCAAPSDAAAALLARASPWLALGCVSPRALYHALQRRLVGAAPSARCAGKAGETGAAGGFSVSLCTLTRPAQWTCSRAAVRHTPGAGRITRCTLALTPCALPLNRRRMAAVRAAVAGLFQAR